MYKTCEPHSVVPSMDLIEHTCLLVVSVSQRSKFLRRALRHHKGTDHQPAPTMVMGSWQLRPNSEPSGGASRATGHPGLRPSAQLTPTQSGHERWALETTRTNKAEESCSRFTTPHPRQGIALANVANERSEETARKILPSGAGGLGNTAVAKDRSDLAAVTEPG